MSIQRVTRAERSADNRRRLLDAARALFEAQGYHPTTLDQVAAEAGLTKGAVYSRFASKADLFLELFAERTRARCAEIRALPPSGERVVDGIVRQWLERIRATRAWSLLVIEFRVEAARSPELNARYAAIHEELVFAVAEVVDRDLRAAGFPIPIGSAVAARSGLALATGLLLEAVANPHLVDEEFVARTHLMLFRGSYIDARRSP